MTLIMFSPTGSDHDGWYPQPQSEVGSQRNGTLNEAFVTCSGQPPSVPADCFAKPCLFNIEDDPCEYHNVAEKYPDVLTKALGVLETYKRSMVPPRDKPVDKEADPRLHGGVWTTWRDEVVDQVTEKQAMDLGI